MKGTNFYVVRVGLSVKLAGCAKVFVGGEIVELTDAQYQLHATRVEEPTKAQMDAWRAAQAAIRKKASDADTAADKRREREALQAEAAAGELLRRAAEFRQSTAA